MTAPIGGPGRKGNVNAKANQIAQQMMGDKDLIKASIWNEFVKDKGGSKVKWGIKEKDAAWSIDRYAERIAREKNTSKEDILNKWLNKDAPVMENDNSKDKQKTSDTSNTSNTVSNNNNKYAESIARSKETYAPDQDVRSPEYRFMTKDEIKELRENVNNHIPGYRDPNRPCNIAYAFQDKSDSIVNVTHENFVFLYKTMQKRMDALGIDPVDNQEEMAKKRDPELLYILAQEIINAEDAILNAD